MRTRKDRASVPSDSWAPSPACSPASSSWACSCAVPPLAEHHARVLQQGHWLERKSSHNTAAARVSKESSNLASLGKFRGISWARRPIGDGAPVILGPDGPSPTEVDDATQQKVEDVGRPATVLGRQAAPRADRLSRDRSLDLTPALAVDDVSRLLH